MFLKEEAERLRLTREENGKKTAANEFVKVHKVAIYQNTIETRNVNAKHEFEVKVTLESNVDLDDAGVGINIKNHDKIMVVSTGTFVNIGSISLKKHMINTVTFKIENILTNGLYSIGVGVVEGPDSLQKVRLRMDGAQDFTIEGIKGHEKALTQPDVRVEVSAPL